MPACSPDDAAFQRDLLALVPQLRAFARTLCRETAEAEDLAQEAVLNAWRARARFEAGTNLKAWCFMILRNQFYSEKRRSWRRQPLDQETAERTIVAPDDPAAPIALAELRQAMALLPDDAREALILIGAGGFSYEETAEILGVAIGTVKSRVSRARERLAQILDEGVSMAGGPSAQTAYPYFMAQVGEIAGRALAA